MSFRGGEFSTGTMGNFQPELTRGSLMIKRIAPARRSLRRLLFDLHLISTRQSCGESPSRPEKAG